MDNTSIKIIGGLSEFNEDKKSGKSLLQRIQEAKSEPEVNTLLEIGKSYKHASVKTMKMWVKASFDKIQSFKV
jgi:hypothetical protein